MARQQAERGGVSLIERGQLVEHLWHAVDHGAANLENVPLLIRRVLETGAWRQRQHKGRVYEHERFIDFVKAKPLAGCGWEPEKVAALLKDDLETLTMWREAIVPGPGRPSDIRSIPTNNDRGRAYTLSRLKRETPELHARVCAGELSPNAAAIEAGFRKKPTPFEQAKKLIPKLSKSEKCKLIELLKGR